MVPLKHAKAFVNDYCILIYSVLVIHAFLVDVIKNESQMQANLCAIRRHMLPNRHFYVGVLLNVANLGNHFSIIRLVA